MAIYRITADDEEQGFMDAFNQYYNTNYKINEVLTEYLPALRERIYHFNARVHGPAIRLMEVQDED